ncbi:MAG: nucleoside triphosphate pyrophosphohydrolase [Flavobacteriaceae bacterium]|tara:strand:- start:34659 stop:35435 length:777 start_codon:yes stop_codon:yes gene_type:complete
MDSLDEQLKEIKQLISIVWELRERCPWDRKQTFKTLKTQTIEETYELCDEIEKLSYDGIKEELGDLLLHVLFYAKMGSEKNKFNIGIIANELTKKLIRRHPHIYEDKKIKNSEEVKLNWEKIKLKEGRSSILDGVPANLPPILKAYRIQEKVSSIGFDWEKSDDVIEKLDEEILEFKEELKKESKDNLEKEFGDILFSLINLSRHYKINPYDALEKSNIKFVKRFKFIEEKTKILKKQINDLDLKEIDILWEQSKNET